jgi:hypothetical protein
MAEFLVQDSSLTAVADAIRAKANNTDEIAFPDGFVAAIGNLQTAPKLQNKGVIPTEENQIIRPDDGYDGLGVVNIHGDKDLIPENIKSGVDVFGVTGTLSPLPSAIPKIAHGTITLDSDTTSTFEIETGIENPNFALLYAEGYTNYYTALGVGDSVLKNNAIGTISVLAKTVNHSGNVYGEIINYTRSTGSAVGHGYNVKKANTWLNTDGTFSIQCVETLMLQGGITYHWIVGVADGI